MQMTDAQLTRKIVKLSEMAEIKKFEFDSEVSKNPTSVKAEAAKSAYYEADDKKRHAEGWLESRLLTRERKCDAGSPPSEQIIGDLMRKKLFS